MRAIAAAIVALLALSACATSSGPRYGPTPDHGPLQARLIPMGVGPLSFQVNRPAHIAIFEVHPSYGVQMLYPRFGGDTERLHAGTHSVWRHHSRYASFDRGLRPASVGWSASGPFQPTVYYLIASERPLRVAPYMGGSGFALNASIGGFFTTNRAFSMMHDLARLVVPTYQDGNWVADMYVEWPRLEDEPRLLPSFVVSCPDGTRHVVPAGINPCVGAPLTPPPPDSIGDPDGDRPQRPDRRRPERDGQQPGRIAGEAGAVDAPDAVSRPERVRGTRSTPRGGEAEGRPGRAAEGQPDRPARGRAAPEPRRESDEGAARSTSRGESTAPQRSAEPAQPPSAASPEPRAAPAPAPPSPPPSPPSPPTSSSSSSTSRDSGAVEPQ